MIAGAIAGAYELLKAAALLVVAVLCMFTGLVAAEGAILSEKVFNKQALTLASFYLLPNISFLAYRQTYSAPRDKSGDVAAAQWYSVWSVISIILMLVVVGLEPGVSFSDFFIAIFISLPLFGYCLASYLLYKKADLRHQSFENLIFIPAFLLCIVNFSIGLLLKRRFDAPAQYFKPEDVLYLSASVGILLLYYLLQVRAAYIYAVSPIVAIGAGLLGFLAFGWVSAKFMALAVMMTFFLLFGEVTKHLFVIARNRPAYADPRGPDFFIQGANWSGVVYPTLFLLSPAIFIEMNLLPIIILVFIFVLFWLSIDQQGKTSKLALVVCFAVGYGTPLAFVASIAWSNAFQTLPITDQTPFQTIFTLIALIGFMAGLLRLCKDLFGLNLHKFTMNLWNRQLYSNEAACLFLLLFISLVVCVILTCSWLVLFVFPEPAAGRHGARALYSNRLVLVGVAVVVLSVLAVLLTIFRPTRLAILLAAVEDINSMGQPQAAERAQHRAGQMAHTPRVWLLVLRSGRLGVSWIAGLAAAVVVHKVRPFWPDACAGFISLTLVTMSGFLINDIYDREKDRLAGKQRPITTGELPIASAQFAAACFILISAGMALVVLGLGASLWILTIASALLAYSPIARKWPLIKSAYTGLLAITPFFFAYHSVGMYVPLTILTILWTYIVFREAVLDAIDLDGDLAAGVRTLAFYLSGKATIIIGWIGMLGSMSVAVFVMETPLSRAMVMFGLSLQIVASLVFIGRPRLGLSITRVTMLTGVLAVALSA